VTILRVPASSANLGPGFDTLGMALTLYLDAGVVGVDPADADAREANDTHPAQVAYRRAGGEGRLWVRSSIPMGRGLGFSGAARVAGAASGVLWRDDRDGADPAGALAAARAELLDLTTELEGHPDNAAASLVGGVTAAAGGRVVGVPVGFDAAVVVWIPDTTTSTDSARKALPSTLALADAVFNVGRTALLVAAFAAGDIAALAEATRDRLHQEVRLAASPGSAAALAGALAGPAWAAWLSGSGPTVAAICAPEAAAEVGRSFGPGGRVLELRIDPLGVRRRTEAV